MGNTRNKGQSAMELVPIVIVVLVIFVITYVLIAREQVVEHKERNKLITEYLCESAGEEINLAALVGDGYSRTFSLPRRMMGLVKYNLTLSKNGLDMTWEGGGDWPRCSVLVTPNVSGTINTDLYAGLNEIRNVGGWVYINE